MNTNSTKEELQRIGHLPEIQSLSVLYESDFLDPDYLRETLMRVASKIVWCPENGKWRCVAVFPLENSRCMYMFFPWTLPDAKKCETRLNEQICICTTGIIEKKEIIDTCKKVFNVLNSAISCMQ